VSRLLVLAVAPDASWQAGPGKTMNDMSYPHITSQGATRARDAASGPTIPKPWWLITDIDGRPLRQTAGLFDRG
jgi:hypothetical protein